MNIIDIIIILVIGLSIFLGYKKGLLRSLYSVGGYFISIFLGFILREPITDILNKTSLPAKISEAVEKKIIAYNGGNSEIQEGLKLPPAFDNILTKLKGSALSDYKADMVKQITSVIVSIIAIIIIIIIVLIISLALKKVILAARKLPIIKQVDALGGMALGLLQGVIILSLAFLVLYMFSSSDKLQGLISLVDKSKLAIFFFKKNILLILISKMKIF